jgi:hypothetical protein
VAVYDVPLLTLQFVCLAGLQTLPPACFTLARLPVQSLAHSEATDEILIRNLVNFVRHIDEHLSFEVGSNKRIHCSG